MFFNAEGFTDGDAEKRAVIIDSNVLYRETKKIVDFIFIKKGIMIDRGDARNFFIGSNPVIRRFLKR